MNNKFLMKAGQTKKNTEVAESTTTKPQEEKKTLTPPKKLLSKKAPILNLKNIQKKDEEVEPVKKIVQEIEIKEKQTLPKEEEIIQTINKAIEDVKKNEETENESFLSEDNKIDLDNELKEVEEKEETVAPKRKTRKTKKAKEKEVIEENNKDITFNQVDYMTIEEAEEQFSDLLSNPTTDEWEIEKEELETKMKSTVIDPDVNTSTIRLVLANIDVLITELSVKVEEYRTSYEVLTQHISQIKAAHATLGSNTEQRKLSSLLSTVNYNNNTESDKYVNLNLLAIYKNERVRYYETLLKALRDRKSLAMTIQSTFKTEINI